MTPDRDHGGCQLCSPPRDGVGTGKAQRWEGGGSQLGPAATSFQCVHALPAKRMHDTSHALHGEQIGSGPRPHSNKGMEKKEGSRFPKRHRTIKCGGRSFLGKLHAPDPAKPAPPCQPPEAPITSAPAGEKKRQPLTRHGLVAKQERREGKNPPRKTPRSLPPKAATQG